jgi:hypothetical protein
VTSELPTNIIARCESHPAPLMYTGTTSICRPSSIFIINLITPIMMSTSASPKMDVSYHRH